MKLIKKLFIGVIAVSIILLTGCESNKADLITVISREDGSGTRGAFIELTGLEEKTAEGNRTDHTTLEAVIVNKTDVMLTNVAGDMAAIGYASLGSLNSNVKAVKVNGVEASAKSISDGTYALSRAFYIAAKNNISEAASDFMSFILSKEGQEVVSQGYIKINENAAPFLSNHAEGRVVVAGSSSVSPVMEKLIEAYNRINPQVNVELQSSDSTSGMQNTIEGICDIGMSSRSLKESEKAVLTEVKIALDGIAIIVNPSNKIEDLTKEEIYKIFAGEMSSWSSFQYKSINVDVD